VTPTCADTAGALAALLAVPPPPDPGQPWLGQSLASGAAGIALLHIERARAGTGSEETVRAWLLAAAGTGISAADSTSLYIGAAAVAFALHTAAAGRPGSYARARASLDGHVASLAHRRVDRADARMDRGELPRLEEFDLIYGLAGIGAHLLAHVPGTDALGRILACLIRLTEPLCAGGETLPGWWVGHDPHFTTSPGFPGGHANVGMAHGISGPLALLSLAMRQGITVDGHLAAIERICAWLDTWRQDAGTGPWWPQWITRADHRAGHPAQAGPGRPSWCYGTPGIARAQQLAGIATRDIRRRQTAEHALDACLADPAQLARITDTSICHGWAGLYQTASRAAADAASPAIQARLPLLADMLSTHAPPSSGTAAGFLEGDAGLALALHAATRAAPPASGWDSCLLSS
jgi:lantibiotic biosynthesis protein